jgi:hypothetical protein
MDPDDHYTSEELERMRNPYPNLGVASGRERWDRVRDKIYLTYDSTFTPEILDCIAGLESDWSRHAVNSFGFRGLYQINRATWEDTQTDWAYDLNVHNVEISTEVAIAILHQKLDAVIRRRDDLTTDEQRIQRAISLFGEGNDLYGEDVMNCADAMGRGNFSEARSWIDHYRANRP